MTMHARRAAAFCLLLVVPMLMPTVGAVTGYALSEAAAPEPCTTPAPAPRPPMLRLRFSF